MIKRTYPDKLPIHIPVYAGSLNHQKIGLNKDVRRAIFSWFAQIQRCFNPNNPGFKTYGALNKQVLYSLRDFVSWWLYEVKLYDGDRGPLVCGRKDHDGDYCFSNIKLESKTSNSMEVHSRYSEKYRFIRRKPVGIFCACCDVELAKVPSFKAAREYLQCSRTTIQNLLKTGRPPRQNKTIYLKLT